MEKMQLDNNGQFPIKTEFGRFTVIWIETQIDDEGNTIFTAWLKEKNGIIVESESIEDVIEDIKKSLWIFNDYENKHL